MRRYRIEGLRLATPAGKSAFVSPPHAAQQ
jgi:hypothetical protein